MSDDIKKESLEMLMQKAEEAFQNSYSPYSNISIGAAVLGQSGKIYTGANIENASYGATICAERTAIVKAISEGEKQIKAIAITGDIKDYAYPCGMCRQVMLEFMTKESIVLVGKSGESKQYKQFTLSELIPHAFDYKKAKKDNHSLKQS